MDTNKTKIDNEPKRSVCPKAFDMDGILEMTSIFATINYASSFVNILVLISRQYLFAFLFLVNFIGKTQNRRK